MERNDSLTRLSGLSDAKRALLAKRLRGELGQAGSGLIPRRQPGETVPLTFAQQRLWFIDQLAPNSDVYNIPASQRLRGPLHLAALQASINEIVRRHEALRTTFASIEGLPIQVIATPCDLPLPAVDLTGLAEDKRETHALLLAEEEAHEPFDLVQGPLLRCKLLKLGPEDHVLLLTIHHIVSDGWSMGLFFQELAALYAAFAAGQPSPLAELPIQYPDFAVWQRRRLDSEALQAELAYWRERLSGVPALELPTDYPRPAIQSFRGDRTSLVVPKYLARALKELSRHEDVTLFMTMLAAFEVLLFRLSGQDNVAVGIPIAGRNRSECEKLIGFFVNTLVLRADLVGTPSFRELLHRVRVETLGAYAHQDLPFEMLVEALHPRRDLSRSPLFQVFFNMTSYVEEPFELPGLTITSLAPSETRSKFDLTLYATEIEDFVYLLLVYNADLFAPERISNLLGQYANLLYQVVKNPDEKITGFSLLTRAAAALLPDPTAVLTRTWEGGVHERFTEQALRVPDKPALVEREETWTYLELDLASSRLAAHLRAHGIGAGDIVAIHGDRSARLVWAVLGVLKAGAAFLILDSAYPAQALVDRLRLARPRAWLQAPGALPAPVGLFLSTLPLACHLELPDRQTMLAGCSHNASGVPVGPDDLAYVVFTSGTTGRPKGILSEHAPLAHFVRWHTETFGLHENDRFSMLSRIAHDPLLRDVFTPLCLGATLVMPELEDIGAPGALAAWLERERITVAHVTPALAKLLDVAPEPGPTRRLPSLRYAFFGTDVLTGNDVAMLRKLAPAATCVNFYGATETPQAMGYYVIETPTEDTRDTRADPVRIPVGSGIDGVQLLVLNPRRGLAGIGELGEIYVRTPYLARGYLGDDTLMQERFVANPFTQLPGDRMFRTGDLARYRPDGKVMFDGRADDQIKIRGFRVEPAEIEGVLSQHAGVRANTVVAQPDASGEPQLVAYVVPFDGATIATRDLQRFLRARLLDYEVPTAFVFLSAMPLTPNGKVDRRALPTTDLTLPAIGEVRVGPRTPVEEILAGIWSQLLGHASVGANDSFFELGGHSLLATQLLARIRSIFRVDLPLRRIFELPTLADMAQAIEEGQAAGNEFRDMPISRAPREQYRARVSSDGALEAPDLLKQKMSSGSDKQRDNEGGS